MSGTSKRARALLPHSYARAHTHTCLPTSTSHPAAAHPSTHPPTIHVHTRTRSHVHTCISCASGNARALSPRQCTASVCDVIKPPAFTLSPAPARFLSLSLFVRREQPPSPAFAASAASSFSAALSLRPSPSFYYYYHYYYYYRCYPPPSDSLSPWLVDNCRRPTWPPLISA